MLALVLAGLVAGGPRPVGRAGSRDHGTAADPGGTPVETAIPTPEPSQPPTEDGNDPGNGKGKGKGHKDGG